MAQNNFIKFTEESPVVLFSGGFGTTLQTHGFKPELPLWSGAANLTHRELVRMVHDEFREAGAHVLSTNSFRTAPETFAAAKSHFETTPETDNPIREAILNDYQAVARLATINALSAAKASVAAHKNAKPLFIAGSYGPLSDTHSMPDVLPDARQTAALLASHRHQASLLAREGVDFILPETASIRAEAQTMAQAASETGKPFIISLSLDPKKGTLWDGASIEEVAHATNLPGRIGVTINCTPAEVIGPALRELLKHTNGFVGAYANGGGQPANDGAGWHHDHTSKGISHFVDKALGWRDQDPDRIKILGGCCGATPEYIKELGQAVANETRPHTIVAVSWAGTAITSGTAPN